MRTIEFPHQLVPELPAPLPVHPAVSEAAVFVTTEENADGIRTHTARFGTALGRDEVLEVLSAPLAEFIPDAQQRDVRQGLRAQTYPNSRIVRNARHLGKTAREGVREMRSDLLGLVQVIDNPEHHTMIPAKIHLYPEVLAEIVARSRVATMKPRAIKALCEEADIALDELTLRRQSQRHGVLRPLQLARAGVSAEALADAFIRSNFTSKKVLAGATDEPVYIPNHEIPPGVSETYPYVERVRRMRPRPDREPRKKTEAEVEAENLAEDIATYWEAFFRQDGTPRHVAMPILRWREAGMRFPSGPKRPVWEPDTLLFDGATKYYDARRHCIVHVSPILGPAMLANSIDPAILGVSLKELFASKKNPYDHSKFPRKAAGVLPALLTSANVGFSVFDSTAFRHLQ